MPRGAHEPLGAPLCSAVSHSSACEIQWECRRVTAAILTLVGSYGTGFLGGILGAGGGVFLVPYLIFVVGVRPIAAVGISIFCVLGTAVGATGKSLEEGRVNVPLALSIEPALIIGAALAAWFAQAVSDRTLLVLFAALMLALAGLFFFARHRVAPEKSELPDHHALDGVFLDERTGAPVAYRPQRMRICGWNHPAHG
jgi:uncharacterized membrane protein YfcA